MLGQHLNDDGRVFRALGLVDRRRIGRHQRVQLAEAVDHLPSIEADSDLTCLRIDPGDKADITVVDLPVVVVLDLHDLVARGVGPAKSLDPWLRLTVQRRLQGDVERSRADPAPGHRTEH